MTNGARVDMPLKQGAIGRVWRPPGKRSHPVLMEASIWPTAPRLCPRSPPGIKRLESS